MTLIKWFKREPQQPKLPKPLPEYRKFVVYYVRTGQYLDAGYCLTMDGRQQACAAADDIRQKAAGHRVVVLGNYRDAKVTPAYLETAETIAGVLHTDVIESPFQYAPTDFDISQMPRVLRLKGSKYREDINHVVRVIDGSNLAYLLREYPGPAVRLGLLGPEHGTVHALMHELNNKREIVNRYFL